MARRYTTPIRSEPGSLHVACAIARSPIPAGALGAPPAAQSHDARRVASGSDRATEDVRCAAADFVAVAAGCMWLSVRAENVTEAGIASFCVERNRRPGGARLGRDRSNAVGCNGQQRPPVRAQLTIHAHRGGRACWRDRACRRCRGTANMLIMWSTQLHRHRLRGRRVDVSAAKKSPSPTRKRSSSPTVVPAGRAPAPVAELRCSRSVADCRRAANQPGCRAE